MKSNIFDRTEVVLIATCFYNKEDKAVKLYLFKDYD